MGERITAILITAYRSTCYYIIYHWPLKRQSMIVMKRNRLLSHLHSNQLFIIILWLAHMAVVRCGFFRITRRCLLSSYYICLLSVAHLWPHVFVLILSPTVKRPLPFHGNHFFVCSVFVARFEFHLHLDLDRSIVLTFDHVIDWLRISCRYIQNYLFAICMRSAPNKKQIGNRNKRQT